MSARGNDKVSRLAPVRSRPVAPSDTLGEEVARERARAFVGREAELTLFRDMLEPDPPCRLLIVHGSRGIGKTTLLEAFHREARKSWVRAIRLDARSLPGDQAAIERRFECALDDIVKAAGCPSALLVDGFEALASIEGWFREALLARLPAETRVVLAMSRRPESAWSLDAGWRGLTRVCELTALSREESLRLLCDLDAPPDRHDEIYRLTGGHPLALALAATLVRSEPQRPLNLDDAPELVRNLTAGHLADAPSTEARQALFACGIARRIDRHLLAAMLDLDEVDPVFEWLRRQSFVRETACGLQAHSLVGEALATELRQHEPGLHSRLIRNGTRYLFRRTAADGDETNIEDALFLMRGLPAIRKTFVISRDTGLSVDRVREGDAEPLAGLVEREWGPESRAWFETWLEKAPEWLAVLRDSERIPVGMSFYLDVGALDAELARADPAVRAFLDHLESFAPLRAGERAMLSRFLVAGDAGGDLTPAVSQLQCHNAFMPLKTRGLVFSGTVRVDLEINRRQARYSGIQPLEATEFELDGHEFFIMGHDWRLEPPLDWLYEITEWLVSGTTAPAPQPAGRVLDETAFAEAVREALRAMAAGRALDDNPLLRAVLVRSTAADPDDAESCVRALHDVVREAVEDLGELARSDELAAVIHHTHLEPAPKQLAAAEEVGLSYGTYRRRLREAIRELTACLWKRELAASRAESLTEHPSDDS